MSYLLRNDDMYTVRVSWTPSRTYLCEVHHGMDCVVRFEAEHAQEVLDVAGRFVDGHISSLYLWSLVHDSTAPPVVRPKSAGYTADCRERVAALYAGRPRSEGFRPNDPVPGAMGG